MIQALLKQPRRGHMLRCVIDYVSLMQHGLLAAVDDDGFMALLPRISEYC